MLIESSEARQFISTIIYFYRYLITDRRQHAVVINTVGDQTVH